MGPFLRNERFAVAESPHQWDSDTYSAVRGDMTRKSPSKRLPVDRKWFDERIADRRMTQTSVAEALGMERWQFNKTLQGKRRPQGEEVDMLAVALGTTRDEVWAHFGLPPPREPAKSARVVGIAPVDGKVGRAPRERLTVPRPSALPQDTVAIRLVEEGGPMDGWLLFFVRSSRIEPEAIGRLAIVSLSDGSTHYSVPTRRGREWALRRICGGTHELPLGVSIVSANPVLLIQP